MTILDFLANISEKLANNKVTTDFSRNMFTNMFFMRETGQSP